MIPLKRYWYSAFLNTFLAVLFPATFSANTYGNNQRTIDSLQRLLTNSPEDTGQIKILYALWCQNIYEDNEKALEYALQQYKLAQKLNYRKGLCNANYCLGFCYSNKGDYPKALSYTLDALKLSEELSDTILMISSLQQISSLYFYQERFDETLPTLFKALKLTEDLKDENYMAGTLCSIGTIYLNKPEYAKALYYFKQSLTLYRKLNKGVDITHVTFNIGEVYKKMNQFEMAMKYYSEAVGSSSNNGNIEDINTQVFVFTSVAEVSGKLGKHAQSIQYFHEALLLSNKISDGKRTKRDIFERMAAEYERAGDYRNANKYYRQYGQLKDSLLNEESISKMAEMETKYEAEKKDKAIQLLEKDKQLQHAKVEKQNTIIWSAAGFIILLTAIAVLLYILWVQKKRAHQSVTWQKEKFSQAIEQSDDLVVITDRNGIVQFVNHGFEEVTGYARCDVMGKKAGMMLKSGKHTQEFYKELWNTVLTGHVYRNVLINKRKSGELYWEAKTITPVKLVGMEFSHFISTGKDITEKIKNEEKFARTSGELNSLLYRISHDLRAPLVTAMGLVNVFRDARDEDTVRQSVNYIGDSVKKMDAVLADINMINVVRQGQLEPIEVTVSAIVEEIFSDYRQQEELSKILLIADIENGLTIMTDLHLFHSLMHNLIDNAIKYRKKGIDDPQVMVKANSNHNGIYLTIEDNGCGMKEEIASKVFDLFFKGNENSQGSGLGLYIVKSAVEKLGGTIEMESTYTKGTKFDIFLPQMNNTHDAKLNSSLQVSQ